MKRNTKHFIILYFVIVILIGFIILSNKGLMVNNHSITLKNMSESTQISNLNKIIDDLNASHTDYANQIQASKQKIANAINMYPNNSATEENSLDQFSTMISNLTNIPENTYYYEDGTEGNSSTIKRYKKIGDSYYVCDANGIVLEGTTATDISSITLIPYNASVAGNISAGSAGYASGSLYLGDGSDNADYIEQGKIEISSSQAGSKITINTNKTNIKRFCAVLIPNDSGIIPLVTTWRSTNSTSQIFHGGIMGQTSCKYPVTSNTALSGNTDVQNNANSSHIWIVGSISTNGQVVLRLPSKTSYCTGYIVWDAI